MEEFTVALAGNPNVGKSTLFNALTGLRQHVGNWPGKTVEKKEGILVRRGKKIRVVDLPGAYSLTAYSAEEIIARNYIVEESPDAVIHIVDVANLERNLYLTVQLIELGANVVVALNMVKLAEAQGIKINEKRLSRLFGIPVKKIEANRNSGISELMDKVLSSGKKPKRRKPIIGYGNEIEDHLAKTEKFIKETIKLPEKYSPKWIALKVLENDREVIKLVEALDGGKDVLEKAEKDRKHLENVFGKDVDTAIADARYGFVMGAVKESASRTCPDRLCFSERMDRVLLNKTLGIPIFLAIVWLMFTITFEVGRPFVELIDGFFAAAGENAASLIAGTNSPAWLSSFVSDGVIGGIGSILVFLPNIALLFLIIAFLEDSGYLARAAFIMDRLMHKIGLHGKSFIPMLLGFGCNVPAVMATRTLESRKDRILTILINPLMSCSARLPVYVLFAGAFFSENQGIVIFSLYLTGIMLAILMGLLFKKLFFKGLSSPFVMELPPYRLPTITGLAIHTWERSKQFVVRAGTIIFAAVILIWFLANLPLGVEYASQQSVVGQIGTAIAPVFEPLGFGNWQSAVSLVFGVVAKEVVVGTFGTLYGVGEEGIGEALKRDFTPLSAYSFMLTTLIYIPCIATIAVIKKETGSWKWTALAITYSLVLAWIVSFVFYQGGLLLGFG